MSASRPGLALFSTGVLAIVVAVVLPEAGVVSSVVGDTTTTMLWLEGSSPSALYLHFGVVLLGLVLMTLGYRRALRRIPPA